MQFAVYVKSRNIVRRNSRQLRNFHDGWSLIILIHCECVSHKAAYGVSDFSHSEGS